MTFRLIRISDQPVLIPRETVRWEQHAVLNTAVVHADGVFHLFYRAVEHPGFTGFDKIGDPDFRYDSCVGHAFSWDGINFTCHEKPVITWSLNGKGKLDYQDPRVTKIDQTYYMVYCIWENGTTYRVYPGYAISDDL